MSETPKLDRRTNAFRPDLADIALASSVQADKFVEPIIRQCIRGVLPLFNQPSFDSSLGSQIRYGEFLDVFELRDDGFAWVQNRTDRYVGYIPYADAFSEEIADLSNRVIALKTFVYPEPNFKTPPIDELTLSSYVRPLRREGEYWELASGGYVFAKDIAPVSEANVADYVFTAGRLLNVPYLWGGRSANGIDCSGLVQLALGMAGHDIPRDADQQRELMGRPLGGHLRDEPWQRGDVVFMLDEKRDPHVGIMTGSDHFLHATKFHMKTVVEPLSDVLDRGYQILGKGKPDA